LQQQRYAGDITRRPGLCVVSSSCFAGVGGSVGRRSMTPRPLPCAVLHWRGPACQGDDGVGAVGLSECLAGDGVRRGGKRERGTSGRWRPSGARRG